MHNTIPKELFSLPPYLKLNIIKPKVISTQEIYLYNGIFSPYIGNIVFIVITAIIFDDFINVLIGKETYINALYEETIESSNKNPCKAYK